jgi:hypothetical protein
VQPVPRVIPRSLALAVTLALAGCHGPGHVEFTDGKCLIDGHVATRLEVEARQARISERILARQPLFVLVTILIVALAGASHLEKLFLFFGRKRDQPVHGIHDRLRLALERYRSHPLRYFSIVALTLSLLGVAGGCYVYLDADKRASERALGLLQFCHIALRNGEAEGILAEQRHNLEQLASTAGNIRALVGKLPPEEQKKAREIVGHINDALSQQGKLVSDYVTRTDESTKAVHEETQLLSKGLTSLETQVTTLRSLPAALHDLGDQLRALDGRVAGGFGDVTARLAASDAKLAAADAKLGDAGAKLAAADAKLAATDAKLAALQARLDALAPAPASRSAAERKPADGKPGELARATPPSDLGAPPSNH